MRTIQRQIPRTDHWRRQRCGPGLSEVRNVHVRGTSVTLARDDVDQLGLLDRTPPPSHVPSASRPDTRGRTAVPPPRDPVRYSYWRSQPYGPKSSLRRMTLVDVRA
jgi:hypothetical protein